MRTPEAHEKTAICKYLDCGSPVVWYFKTFTGGFGKSGTPDIVGVYKYRGFFAIEVKRDGKEPTPLQKLRMEKIDAAGGKTFWGTAGKVIEEFERWIGD